MQTNHVRACVIWKFRLPWEALLQWPCFGFAMHQVLGFFSFRICFFEKEAQLGQHQGCGLYGLRQVFQTKEVLSLVSNIQPMDFRRRHLSMSSSCAEQQTAKDWSLIRIFRRFHDSLMRETKAGATYSRSYHPCKSP